jgi:uncharacterized protein YcfJ
MDSKLILGIGVGVVIAIGGMAAAQRFAGSASADPEAARAATAPQQLVADEPTRSNDDAAPRDDYYTTRKDSRSDTRNDEMYADVRRVRPVIEQVTTPRKECEQATVTRRQAERDGNVGGTVLGAVIGGALGNQVGRGNGRKAATVAGAVAGGFVGHEMDQRHQGGKVITTTETRCKNVNETSDKIVGYDVTYIHNGREYTTRMDNDPGDRLLVEPTVRPVDTAR